MLSASSLTHERRTNLRSYHLTGISRMYSSLLLRSAVRRNLVSQSARCFASRAPPPPTSAPKAPRAESVPKPEAAERLPAPEVLPSENAATEQPLSSLPSLDFAPGEEPHRERTGAKSSKDSLSSIERKRRLYSRVSVGALLIGLGVQTWFMGRELEEEELKEFRLVCLMSYLGRRMACSHFECRNVRMHHKQDGAGPHSVSKASSM